VDLLYDEIGHRAAFLAVILSLLHQVCLPIYIPTAPRHTPSSTPSGQLSSGVIAAAVIIGLIFIGVLVIGVIVLVVVFLKWHGRMI